jgi:beta-glucosidase
VATAAYQIEGAVNEGGRSPSIWDTFSHTVGKTSSGETGDIACDHYHKVDEDIALLKELGVKAYRFSISWSRLLPNGFNENKEGVDFYNHLIDKLLENDIEPFLTMYHWDLPQCLQDKGGWENRDIVDWFDNYSSKIVQLFGDRVKHMITLNEPSIFLKMGFFDGIKAPGKRLPFEELPKIIHNILLAHGTAVSNVRKYFDDIKVGITLAVSPVVPEGHTQKEEAQAHDSIQWVDNDIYGNFLYSMRLWGDPIFFKQYFHNYKYHLGKYIPMQENDMEIIGQPIDFLGINSYTSTLVQEQKDGSMAYFPNRHGGPKNILGWETIPETLYYVTKEAYNTYGVPIYITENGYCAYDSVSLDEKVHDPQRIDYMERYLIGLKKAKDEGADIQGYFYWSFLDNYEWECGYGPRFGLVFTDYLNKQKRIPKDSFYWYQKLIN